MARVTRMDSSRLYSPLAAEGLDTEGAHLGGAAETIDRLVPTSPKGELEITAGFLKHRVKANWKFMPSRTNAKTITQPSCTPRSSASPTARGSASSHGGAKSTAVTRDYGNGHTEMDLRPRVRPQATSR